MGSLYSVSSTTGDITTAGTITSNTTSSGLLFPRLTTAQRNAISSPSAGMQIYNTDTNKDEFYNGTVWNSIDSGITQLTSDVTAGPGSGSQAATVASVGGSSASNIHSAELAANAATNANTFSTIVKRDSSGNFSATTITASLTGHASADLALTGGTLTGDLTLANEHAVIFNDTEISPKSVTLEAPTTLTNSYTLKWPLDQASGTQVLTNDGSGNLSWTSGGSGANTSLSNLSAVAINTSLLPASNNSIDLGSSSFDWRSVYLKTSLVVQQTGAGTNAVTIQSPSSVTSYTITLPSTQGAANTALLNDGSGNLSFSSVLPYLAKIALTAQGADIALTTLFTAPATGLYLLNAYAVTTTSDGGAGASVAVSLGPWTDDFGANGPMNANPLLDLTATGANSLTTFCVEVTSGSTVSYSVTGGGTYGTAQYSLYIVAERLS